MRGAMSRTLRFPGRCVMGVATMAAPRVHSCVCGQVGTLLRGLFAALSVLDRRDQPRPWFVLPCCRTAAVRHFSPTMQGNLHLLDSHDCPGVHATTRAGLPVC